MQTRRQPYYLRMRQTTLWLSLTALVISCLLVGCGGKSKQEIDMAVTPSAPSIHLSDAVVLHASGSSLIQGTSVGWAIEQEDPSCSIESTLPESPSGSCPSGSLWVPTPTGNLPATDATYSAPITPGTYHVVAKAQLLTGETGQSVSTITVTPHTVDVTITPATATILINSSVDLQAIGSSITKYTLIDWYLDGEGNSCTAMSDPSQPRQEPSGPCPSGWVWQEETYGFTPSSQATYYSPGTPGTYHVVASAELGTGETGQSISTITVIP